MVKYGAEMFYGLGECSVGLKDSYLAVIGIKGELHWDSPKLVVRHERWAPSQMRSVREESPIMDEIAVWSCPHADHARLGIRQL